MASTTANYNLYKPAPNQMDVAGSLNNNLDVIDNLIKQLQDTKASIADLNTKANTNHTHGDYAQSDQLNAIASDVAGLAVTKLDKSEFLNINESISGKTPSVTIGGSGGNSAVVTILASLDSSAPILRWTFNVAYSNGALGFTISQNSPVLTVNKTDSEAMINVSVSAVNPIGNTISNVGGASASILPYSGPGFIVDTIDNLNNIITNELSLANILDAIAQDVDIMQSQANVLQHSDILIQKVATVIRQMQLASQS